MDSPPFCTAVMAFMAFLFLFTCLKWGHASVALLTDKLGFSGATSPSLNIPACIPFSFNSALIKVSVKTCYSFFVNACMRVSVFLHFFISYIWGFSGIYHQLFVYNTQVCSDVGFIFFFFMPELSSRSLSLSLLISTFFSWVSWFLVISWHKNHTTLWSVSLVTPCWCWFLTPKTKNSLDQIKMGAISDLSTFWILYVSV